MISKNFLFIYFMICIQNIFAQSPLFSLQDNQQAAQYFQDLLNFHTNVHGVHSIQNGKMKINKDEVKAVIIDVRAEKDYKKGHIPGALNIPYDKFDTFSEFYKEFPSLIQDGFNIVYCYTRDCNLAQKACQRFAALGYPVKEMVGGFEEWANHKYSIEK